MELPWSIIGRWPDECLRHTVPLPPAQPTTHPRSRLGLAQRPSAVHTGDRSRSLPQDMGSPFQKVNARRQTGRRRAARSRITAIAFM
jgi:hypothetical protein